MSRLTLGLGLALLLALSLLASAPARLLSRVLPADLVLMQALLIGWGLCSGISIASLTVAVGATMFGIPPTELITRANIAFVFLTSLIAAGLLWALNGVLV